jgi:hypothetical protein
MLLTLDSAIKRVFRDEKVYPGTEYVTQWDREKIVRQAWPQISISGNEIVVTETDKSHVPSLKEAGFRFTLGEWRKKVRNASEMIDTLKKLDFEFMAGTVELERVLLTRL